MKKFFKEFKDFVCRGNIFDMAVGMIIATAFNKIVSSLVNDIIMPLITWATGAGSLKELSIPLRYNELGEVTLTWAYGNFIQTIIDFLIIATSIFIVVKVINSSRKKLEELGEFAKQQSKKEVKAENKALRAKAKAEGRSFKEVYEENQALKAKQAEEARLAKEAEDKAKAEAELLANPTTEMLLKDIRELLRQQQNQQ
ncbi:MAG: large conductance mechanosensitive channel protein MscL [Clostridia bacterium]|nr:large conductance mechanosensitive channel protein MscL [Clostridia bacterium]MDY4083275.1 large conductance mechanosensitive channel protein MscL [Eubacteriales bacterium]